MKTVTKVISEPGGWAVTIEVANAYTDGASRFDVIHLPFAAYSPDKTADELMAAVADAHDWHLDPVAPFQAVAALDMDHWTELRRTIPEPIASKRVAPYDPTPDPGASAPPARNRRRKS